MKPKTIELIKAEARKYVQDFYDNSGEEPDYIEELGLESDAQLDNITHKMFDDILKECGEDISNKQEAINIYAQEFNEAVFQMILLIEESDGGKTRF